jgi:hypothetical protein
MQIHERDEAPARGWKTNKVLECLETGVRHMNEIRTYTGLDFRTINAILYALQNQGRVAPIEEHMAKPKSQMSFALVGGPIKPVEIIRQVPLKTRRRHPPFSAAVNPNAGADELPSWITPQLPRDFQRRPVGFVHACMLD